MNTTATLIDRYTKLWLSAFRIILLTHKLSKMAIKEIRKKLKDAGIDGTVKYLGVGINEYSCQYKITFPKIKDNEYWDEPIEVIDDYDA